MKKLALLLLICIGALLHAQLEWGELGVSFTKDKFMNWEESAITIDDDVIVAWSETGERDFDIFACRYNSEGEAVWDEPLLVCDADNIQCEARLICGSDGNFIICWKDFREPEINSSNYHPELYLQKIDESGNILWSNNGILTARMHSENFNFISDENGGCLMAFENENHDLEIRNYNSEGGLNLEMGIITQQTNLSEICIADRQLFTYDSEFVIIWQSYEDGYYLNADRYDMYGNSVWEGCVSYSRPALNWIDWTIFDNTLVGIFRIGGTFNLKKLDLATGLFIEDLLIDTFLNVACVEFVNDSIIFLGTAQSDYFIEKYDLAAQLTDSVYLYPHSNCQYQVQFSDNEGLSILHTEQYSNMGEPYYELNYFHLNDEMEIEEQYLEFQTTEGYFDLAVLLSTQTGEIALYRDHHLSSLKLNMLVKTDGEAFSQSYDLNSASSISSSNCFSFINGDNLLIGNSRISSQLQGFDSEGEIIWTEPGIDLGNFETFRSAPLYDDEAESYIMFGSVYTEDNQQRLLLTGITVDEDPQYLWGEEGIIIKDNCDDIISASIDKFGINDYLAVWNEEGVIYAQRIYNGEMMWDEQGIALMNTFNTDYHQISIINDYLILAYQDYFYITRLAEDGNWYPGWNGFLSMQVEFYSNEDLSIDLSDLGLKLIWEDYVNQIKAQMISPEGEFLYGIEGIVLIEDDALNTSSLQVVYDSENTYICYFDHFNLQFSIWDNYLQMLHTNSITTDKYCTKMVKKGNYLLMTRSNSANMATSDYLDLFALDLLGNPADILENNPMVIIDEWWNTHVSDLLVDDDNAYIVWYDLRNNMSHEPWYESQPTGGNRIYAQKVALETNSEDENQVSAVSQFQIYPNPFNPEITIKWQLAEIGENSRLAVFNIKGQKVREYLLNTKAGQVIWDGKDARQQQCASGVYLLKLQSGDEKQGAKVLMLK